MAGQAPAFHRASDPAHLVSGQRHLVELFLSSFFINVVALALPLSMLQIYDRILPNHNMATLDLLALGVISALILEMLLRTLREGLAGLVSARFEHRGHYESLRRLLSLPMSRFEKDGGGTHLERLSSVDKLRDFHGGRMLLALADLPFIGIFLFVILFLGGWLVFVPILMTAVFVMVSLHQGDKLRSATEETGEQYERRFNFMLETLSGIQTVKALSAEAQMLRRFERLLENAISGRHILAIRQGAVQMLGAIFTQALTVGTVAFGAMLVVDHQMTVGSLGACTMLAGRIAPPVQAALSVWLRRQSNTMAEQRVAETFAIALDEDKDPLVIDKGVLTLDNVCYGRRPDGSWLLDSVSLTLRPGDSISIRGANGSGKSLLLWLMTGHLVPEQGRVLVDGQDLANVRRDDLWQATGFLGEHGELVAGTFLENLTLFDHERERTALAVAEELGLNEFAASLAQGFDAPLGGRIGSALPRGVIQRISIARILALDPAVILFDDANTLLDGASDQLLMQAMQRRMKDRAFVIVSHRPSTLKIAQCHYELVAGRLVPLPGPDGVVRAVPPEQGA
ncbi:ATP-binding cassette domain-containing protein [Haematospirillum sp. 15-248]|uniref:peptidase domain-containing ABC transporter n=1 Tax=Haematospirillum sp. 15-248 TaxID=2723107 RepID=UPI00143BD048|nr:ABC transporter transmembrane domain-containing protein [Haematospirillum sp. 15-248]NKD87853.1 ATP-binding cassette domain-containing protein [Haematospirillum sp. 15-248]